MKSLERIAVVPAQLYGAPPHDPLREGVKTALVIGTDKVEHPIELETPILLSGTPEAYSNMESREALIHGASAAKTILDTGSLGLTDDEKTLAKKIGAMTMMQLTPARLGVSAPKLAGSDAIEISLTHGGSGSADARAGSVIVPQSIAPELFEALELKNEDVLYAPPRFLDMDTPRDLTLIVQLARELTRHEVPVFVKMGPGLVYNDIRIAVKAAPDAVVLDCMRDRFTYYHHHGDNQLSAPPQAPGSSYDNILPAEEGASGLPLMGVLAPLSKALSESKADKAGVKVFIKADITSGADIFKIMAFGASGVVLNSAHLRAAGIIAEDQPQIVTKINPEQAGAKMADFLSSALMELKALTAWAGHDSTNAITTDNLRALTYNTAAVTGLKLVGYDNILTMWEH
jgi:glutamate synthase domain-containing protein 2